MGRTLMAPRAAARWAPVTRRDDDTLVVEDEPLALPGIGERWGAVEHVAVAVCTIGEALEQRVSVLWEARELPLASMLDSVGSGAVESLAEYVNDLLCAQGLAGPAGDQPRQPRLRRLGRGRAAAAVPAVRRRRRSASR